MNWIVAITMFVLSASVILYLWYRSGEISELDAVIPTTFFGPTIVCLLYALVCTGIISSYDYDPYIRSTANIVSIRNGSGFEGRTFFLGRGYINSTEHYVAYYKRTDGGIVQYHSNVNRSIIYEDSDDSPYIEVIHTKPKLTGWFKHVSILNQSYIDSQEDRYLKTNYHVPKNTVVCDFNIK